MLPPTAAVPDLRGPWSGCVKRVLPRQAARAPPEGDVPRSVAEGGAAQTAGARGAASDQLQQDLNLATWRQVRPSHLVKHDL